MRRLSDTDQLAHRIDQSDVVSEAEIRELAKYVATFHAECAVDQRSDLERHWVAIRQGWLRECDELDALGDDVAPAADRSELRCLGLQYLAGRESLFERRLLGGHVREGYDDLRCDHVYLTPHGPPVVDCDRTLRAADVVSDVASLVMDLERRGVPELAGQFLAAYREFSAETYPDSLLDYYLSLAAMVRAKVDATRARQLRCESVQDQREAIRFATGHIRRAIPMVIVIGGLPGSGKTTISDEYAMTSSVVHISSDEIRRGRHDVDADDPKAPEWEGGAYTPAATAAVYGELISRAHAALANGCSVILDASWRSVVERERARQLSRKSWAIPLELHCVVDNHLAYPRLTGTREGYSPAGVAIRRRMVALYQPWPTAAIISTAGSTTESIEQIAGLVEAARGTVTSTRLVTSPELAAPPASALSA